MTTGKKQHSQVKQKPGAKRPIREVETILPAKKKKPSKAISLREEEGDVSTYLVVNSAKVNTMQPTLIGLTKFGSLAVNLAAWWQETLDGQRDYYSLSINDSVKLKQAWQKGGEKQKIEPLARLKLYQFRRSETIDPDYVSSEPFIYEGKGYWGLLWVDIPEDYPPPEEVTEQDLKRIAYQLVFSVRRPSEKWENQLKDSIRSSQEHLLARRRELETRKLLQRRAVEDAADEIPMD